MIVSVTSRPTELMSIHFLPGKGKTSKGAGEV